MYLKPPVSCSVHDGSARAEDTALQAWPSIGKLTSHFVYTIPCSGKVPQSQLPPSTGRAQQPAPPSRAAESCLLKDSCDSDPALLATKIRIQLLPMTFTLS